jgi:hypothetical protein
LDDRLSTLHHVVAAKGERSLVLVAGDAHDSHEEGKSYDRNTADVERWKPAENPRIFVEQTVVDSVYEAHRF